MLKTLQQVVAYYEAQLKNVKPSDLARVTALLVGIGAFFGGILAMLILRVFVIYSVNYFLPYLVGLVLLFSSIAYYLFYYALENFIYRRVKLIYKNIYRLKRDAKIQLAEPNLEMNTNVLDNVEAAVIDWDTENRQEIEQLKKMEIYRREFLGNVSHELKTPIFNIQGYLETLMDGGINDPSICNRYLRKAAENTDRLSLIVNELVLISKIEAGELQLNIAPFKIGDLVQEVIELNEELAKKQHITLKIKEGSDRNMRIEADRDKISQVLNNLVINSIKYGKQNGTTTIGLYNMNKYALIEVTDNGIGIEAKHLPRLFERFYRIDKSRSRESGGSGLGLAICKHIIETHNEHMHVRSKPNVGSTFGFTLKIARKWR
ncbi:MAG: sensor histidine kinase [Sphingobacteriales bacterium]|nr:sensor histidine kinase [Sphingobacteriales bacterium]